MRNIPNQQIPFLMEYNNTQCQRGNAYIKNYYVCIYCHFKNTYITNYYDINSARSLISKIVIKQLYQDAFTTHHVKLMLMAKQCFNSRYYDNVDLLYEIFIVWSIKTILWVEVVHQIASLRLSFYCQFVESVIKGRHRLTLKDWARLGGRGVVNGY